MAVLVSHTIKADALAWESGECAVAVNGLLPLGSRVSFAWLSPT